MWLRPCLLLLLYGLPVAAWAHHHDGKADDGLGDTMALIVRHAEKADASKGLSARGEQRAQAYASYFALLQLDGQSLRPQRLIATRDSKESARPRLTLSPLSQRIGLPIEQPWADDQVDALAKSLRQQNQAPVILIAWHHGHIEQPIDALGGKAKSLLGGKSWPEDVYDWLIVLRFDHHGKVVEQCSERVQEHLLPGD